MNGFKVFYDEDADILFLGCEGKEEEFVEIQPNVHVELDKNKNIIGVEILNASKILKNAVSKMSSKVKA